MEPFHPPLGRVSAPPLSQSKNFLAHAQKFAFMKFSIPPS